MNKIDINGNDKAQNDHTDYSAFYQLWAKKTIFQSSFFLP